jgi:hypothetical protein
MAADAARARTPLRDCNNTPLEHPIGNTLRIRAAFFNGSSLEDISDITSITVEIKQVGAIPADPAIVQWVSGTGDIDTTLTLQEWKARIGSHIDLTFTDEEMNNFSEPKHYLLCIWGIGTGGIVKTWVSQKIEIYQAGTGVDTTAPLPPDSYYTSTEVDALLSSYYTKLEVDDIIGSGGELLNVTDVGVLGDGTTDDTTAIIAADAQAATEGRRLYFPDGAYKITAAITATAIWYMKGALKPTGSGYTALTIENTPGFFRAGWRINIDSGVYIVAGRPTVNGLYWDNLAGSNVEAIRINGLDGFGLKTYKLWDSFVATVSIELCGNASNYALELEGGGGETCNESHFGRIQVEQAQQRAIKIHGDTLNCHFSLIHCERWACASAATIIELGANRGRYDCVRISGLTETDQTNGRILLTGAQASYSNVLVEGATSVVTAEGYSGNTIDIHTPEFQGAFRLVTDQTGTVNVFGGKINTINNYYHGLRCFGVRIASITDGNTLNLDSAIFNTCEIGAVSMTSERYLTFRGGKITTLTHTNVSHIRAHGVHIGTLSVGDCTSDRLETRVQVFDCIVDTLTSNNTQSALTMQGGQVGTVSTDFPNHTYAFNVTFLQTAELIAAYCTIRAYDCAFKSAFTSDNGIITMDSCRIAGELKQSAGSISGVFTGQMEIGGAVTLASLGTSAPAAGTWKRGQRTDNLRPVVGSPTGWLCTVAGTPGTWVALANL